MRKPRKTVEIVLRVSVPGHWSAAHAKRQVAEQWYGTIDAYGPTGQRGAPDWWGDETTLRPRWGRARVVKPDA